MRLELFGLRSAWPGSAPAESPSTRDRATAFRELTESVRSGFLVAPARGKVTMKAAGSEDTISCRRRGSCAGLQQPELKEGSCPLQPVSCGATRAKCNRGPK